MILWQGPSEIDGSPIVAIATVGSKNPKTGDMCQVWILRSDIAPHLAVAKGLDSAICGDCPQRHFLGGSCYVTTHQAPLSVFKRFQAGGYDAPRYVAKVEQALKTLPIRLGAYGDPAAVPFHVWESLLAQGNGRFTGYTHQWRNPRVQAYRAFLMASCDTLAEAKQAKALGWRYFLVQSGSDPVDGAVECLSDAKDLTCAACGICDGTRADSRSLLAASVVIQVHGARAKRFAALQVLR